MDGLQKKKKIQAEHQGRQRKGWVLFNKSVIIVNKSITKLVLSSKNKMNT